ncbi:MAG: ATP-binding protein [Candidatus Omnitrophota bacterium]
MQNKLIHKLTIQIIIIVVIIAGVFSFLINMQTKELEKRISEKSELFSKILGAHLDNIIGNNLIAYNSLQEKVERLIEGNKDIEELIIIGPEKIVIASSSGRKIGASPDMQYMGIINEVVQTKKSKAIVKSDLGKELVIHFLPIFSSAGNADNLIGIMQMKANFPSQQGELVTALRKNRNYFFKEEALRFAQDLSRDLELVMAEVNRNSGYLDRLIQNILEDAEIKDIKLYLKDLQFLISGTGRDSYISQDDIQRNYFRAMQEKITFKAQYKKQGHLTQFISPLFLTVDGKRKVSGAVGILISLERVYDVINTRRNSIVLMSFLIICAFVLIIGLFFRNSIIAPLKNLSNMSAKIGKGDFSQKISIKGTDEISDLGKSFNQMSDELLRSKKEIEEWNKKLQEKVKIISNELEAKQAQLIESEKMASLGVLSSGIAHEINNPLGIIIGSVQMILKELKEKQTLANPQQTEELLKTVENYTRRCSHIVNSLLQFANKKQMQLIESDVNKSVENALLFTENHIKKNNINLIQSLEKDLPQVLADPINLEQVFINIILNAQMSMPEGGQLKVSTALAGNRVMVSFEDTGMGIAAGNMHKIFEPFFSTREPGKGAGLGLSISYGIIKAHNGDIKVESAVGKGTKVTVEIPIKERKE